MASTRLLLDYFYASLAPYLHFSGHFTSFAATPELTGHYLHAEPSLPPSCEVHDAVMTIPRFER
jgi:hypothetical protein